MAEQKREYPDNSAIHEMKAKWRKEQAKLSFAEKLDLLDDLRERVEPIVRAREARKAERNFDP